MRLRNGAAADENNQKALWYSGLMAVRAGDPDTARVRWTRLLETDPPAEIRQILVAQLAELGVNVPQPAAAPAAATAGGMGGMTAGATESGETRGRTIRIAVSVDPSLAGKLQPGAVVSVTQSPGGVLVGSGGEAAELDTDIASHVFVAKR